MPRKRDNIDREERKEETLRPSPYIGYNRGKFRFDMTNIGYNLKLYAS